VNPDRRSKKRLNIGAVNFTVLPIFGMPVFEKTPFYRYFLVRAAKQMRGIATGFRNDAGAGTQKCHVNR